MDTENTRTLPGTGKLSSERLNQVEKLVSERLGEAIHVEDLAAAAGLSPFHFSRMFHAATGKAPHAYVTAASGPGGWREAMLGADALDSAGERQ